MKTLNTITNHNPENELQFVVYQHEIADFMRQQQNESRDDQSTEVMARLNGILEDLEATGKALDLELDTDLLGHIKTLREMSKAATLEETSDLEKALDMTMKSLAFAGLYSIGYQLPPEAYDYINHLKDNMSTIDTTGWLIAAAIITVVVAIVIFAAIYIPFNLLFPLSKVTEAVQNQDGLDIVKDFNNGVKDLFDNDPTVEQSSPEVVDRGLGRPQRPDHNDPIGTSRPDRGRPVGAAPGHTPLGRNDSGVFAPGSRHRASERVAVEERLHSTYNDCRTRNLWRAGV